MDGYVRHPRRIHDMVQALFGGGGHEQVLDVRAGSEGLPDTLGAFHQEPAVLLAHGSLLQADGGGHALVVGGGDHRPPARRGRPWPTAGLRCWRRATATSDANATGSITARSARIFRSSSRPATRRPRTKLE